MSQYLRNKCKRKDNLANDVNKSGKMNSSQIQLLNIYDLEAGGRKENLEFNCIINKNVNIVIFCFSRKLISHKIYVKMMERRKMDG